MQQNNPENRLSETQSKKLVVNLEKGDWYKFMPMSDYMRMAPSKPGCALLKQVLLQYQFREEMDNKVFKLPAQIPIIRSLSQREIEILILVAQDNSNKGIARILGISEQTIKSHISSILRKLKAENRIHPAICALEQNLAEPKISSQNNHDDNFRLAANVRQGRELDGYEIQNMKIR
jgi:DNA-binding CsgD family transcriptional regulator